MSTDLEFTWEGLTLAGTLHLPSGEPPHPAVLMMQGSGPADRDNDVLFPPIRNEFLRRDIACFSFDKPGVGRSTGDWRHYPLQRRADQSLAAVKLLAGHPDIDERRIGFFGHSQGGWLAQMLGATGRGGSFAISNSGPSIGVAAQDLHGCEHSMRAERHEEHEIAEALHFLAAIHREARKGTDYEEVERRLLEAARGENWYGYVAIEEPEDWDLMRALISEAYDPLQALARITCPFLAIYGGRDVLLPASEDAQRAGDALRAAETHDATVVVFPTGDHRMQRDGSFVPGYLDLIADWAGQRT